MLEYAVRPFGPPDAQGTTRIPATPRSTRERATLTWGGQSTLPQPVFTSVDTACCAEGNKETSRTGETVRINGDDGESFIDVFRANTVNLDKTGVKTCGINGDSQTISAEFDQGDAFTTTTGPAEKCKVVWKLNNNTAAAGGGGGGSGPSSLLGLASVGP